MLIQCPPGDESGGEEAEDEDEAASRKRAKPTAAGQWARGSGARG